MDGEATVEKALRDQDHQETGHQRTTTDTIRLHQNTGSQQEDVDKVETTKDGEAAVRKALEDQDHQGADHQKTTTATIKTPPNMGRTSTRGTFLTSIGREKGTGQRGASGKNSLTIQRTTAGTEGSRKIEN